MSTFIVVAAAWLIIAILLAGVGVVIWMGIDTAVRGWQLFEQLRRDRQDEERDR